MRSKAGVSLAVAGVLVLAGCAAGPSRVDQSTAEPTATSSAVRPTSTAPLPSTTSSAGPAATVAAVGAAPSSATSVDPRLVPLVADHNQPHARRINMVFVEHGFPKGYDWIGLARTLLAWDGPTALYIREVNGVQQFSTKPDGGRVDQRGWGPFSVDPIRSSRNRFNVWAFTTPERTPTYYTFDGHKLPVALPDTVVVELAWKWSAPTGITPPGAVPVPARAVGMHPTAFQPPALPKAGSNPFYGVTLAIDPDTAYSMGNTLTHELGHAIFNVFGSVNRRWVERVLAVWR